VSRSKGPSRKLMSGQGCCEVELTNLWPCTTRYDHNMRMDERSRLKSVGNENDFQIVCGNMYSAIFMMNSSGYGEHGAQRISAVDARADGGFDRSDLYECRSGTVDGVQIRRDIKRCGPVFGTIGPR
jgi:hypothetical protein